MFGPRLCLMVTGGFTEVPRGFTDCVRRYDVAARPLEVLSLASFSSVTHMVTSRNRQGNDLLMVTPNQQHHIQLPP